MPDATERTNDVRNLSRPLLKAVVVLEPVVRVGAVVGVVSGIVFATATAPAISLGVFSRISTTNSHPFVGAGIAISVASVLGGAVMWAIARAVRVVLLDLSLRYDLEIRQ